MKAHVRKEPPAILRAYPEMTEADIKAWNRTEKWRMEEYEAMANAILISVLYALSINEQDPHGAKRLRRDWEDIIRCRAEARRDLRVQMGTYELAATGKNVEDYYMYEELRKKGADVLAWERAVRMDEEGNVFFSDKEAWKK